MSGLRYGIFSAGIRLRRRNSARSISSLRARQIHHALHRERRLRIARAAHRRDRRFVGMRRDHVHRQRRHNIRPGQRGGGIVRDVHVLQRIGADVVNKAATHAAHAAVGIRRKLDRPILVALLRRIGEMLAAVLDPFHRAAEQRRGGDHRDVLGIDAKLRPEAAADIGRRHPQPAFVEIDIVGEGGAQIVRLLRRSPDHGLAIGDLCENAAAFHRMAGAAMHPQIVAHHMRRLGESRIDVAISDLVGNNRVRGELAAHRRRPLDPAIDRRRQHVVIDRDQRGSVFGDIAVLGKTIATGSPTKDTSPSASANGQLRSSSVPEFEVRTIRRRLSTGARSSSVSTATTPGSSRAALASKPRIRACGCGLRTNAATSAPAAAISSTKRPLPVKSAWSSSRRMRAPMTSVTD